MTALQQSPGIGARIAPHLTLRSELGRGGIATVFEAYHTRLAASVAVKIVTLEGDRMREAGQRLVHEARLCARLDDPHVPRVYDVSTLPDGRPYLVMEKVPGGTLEQHLQQGPLPIAEVIRIGHELLTALRAVHAAGIVHRDIKSANVMLQWTQGGGLWVRLLDFGIAYDQHDQLGQAEWGRSEGIVGTPGYMPPEQLNADGVDPRSDLYALGVVLYEMLTGDMPFPDDEGIALLHRSAHEDVPDVRRRRPDCPAWLARVVVCATERDRDARFASAEAMLSALDDWTLAATPRPGTLRRSDLPLNYAPAGWLAATAALALAGAVWLVARGDSSQAAAGPAFVIETPQSGPTYELPPGMPEPAVQAVPDVDLSSDTLRALSERAVSAPQEEAEPGEDAEAELSEEAEPGEDAEAELSDDAEPDEDAEAELSDDAADAAPEPEARERSVDRDRRRRRHARRAQEVIFHRSFQPEAPSVQAPAEEVEEGVRDVEPAPEGPIPPNPFATP